MKSRRGAEISCVRRRKLGNDYVYNVYYETRNKDGSFRHRQYWRNEELPDNVKKFLESAVKYTIDYHGGKATMFHRE